MRRKLVYLSFVILTGFALFNGCSSKSSVSPNDMPITQNGNTVDIKNFAFSPSSITINVGTTVTWTNSDVVSHTVTEVHNSFDSGGIAPGTAFKLKFTTPGTYTYHCTIHSMMANATVVVNN